MPRLFQLTNSVMDLPGKPVTGTPSISLISNFIIWQGLFTAWNQILERRLSEIDREPVTFLIK